MRPMRIPLVLACVLLVPGLAYAQASITGVVRDTSGAVLPGVTVEAASPALIEKVRTVVTDDGGQYRIVDLRPGPYIVSFALAGFATVKREGIELSGSLTATVNVEMRVGGVEETITVSSETPLVDVQSVVQQRVLTKDVIDTLPTGRTTVNVAVLIPGMNLSTTFSGEGQDVGGTTGEVQQTLSIHGSRGGDMRRMVDGLSMQSQGTSVSAFAPNGGMVQEVTVDTSGASAEAATGGVRMNIVPREGGNEFSGSFFATGASEDFQSTNVDQELIDRRIVSPNAVKSTWEVNPAFGGPIVRDKLWFFTSARWMEVNNYIAGAVRNANAGNANAWTYSPDTSFRGSRDTSWVSVNGRLTWQANTKNKLSMFVDAQDRCSCYDTRQLTSPEATADFRFPWKSLVTVSYTSTLTSKVLIEAGYGHKPEDWGYFTHEGDEAVEQLIGVQDLASGLFYRGPRNYFMNSMRFQAHLMDDSWRAAISYVTGGHAFKVGYQAHTGYTRGDYNIPVEHGSLSYTFNNGVPTQINVRNPYGSETQVHDGGIYAQDRWTIGRVTMNLGVRYDFYRTSFPEQTLGPTQYTPNRNLSLSAGDLASFNDITPKLGVAYDLFGNGKTAVKASLSKFVEQLTYTGEYGDTANPAQRTSQFVNRAWTDGNGNFTPDCDLLNPLAQDFRGSGGDLCGQISNVNFGQPIPSLTYDPDILRGWGKRGYNWEGSVSLQHEIVRNVSAEVGYFRRWYGNFLVTDNRAVTAADYTPYTIVAPSNPDLPDGGGYTVGSVYDVIPTKFGQTDNFRTFADNYGKQIENWHGVDLTVNARLGAGAFVQGGFSTGRTLIDRCDLIDELPEALFGFTVLGAGNNNVWSPTSACRQASPFLTQVKLLGAYTIPRLDVQTAVTFQSIPGPHLISNLVVPTAVAAQTLGRPLAGNAQTAQVNILEPGELYGDRLNQIDFRIGKIFRLAGVRTAVNFDLFNALNGNAVLTENVNYALFRQPLSILNARLAKISMNIDF